MSNDSLIEKLEQLKALEYAKRDIHYNQGVDDCIKIVERHWQAYVPTEPPIWCIEHYPNKCNCNMGDAAGLSTNEIYRSPELSTDNVKEQPIELSQSALDEALLTMRPQVWQDITQQVMLGEIPAAQLPMKVEMWQQSFRPFLAKAIEAYFAHTTMREYRP